MLYSNPPPQKKAPSLKNYEVRNRKKRGNQVKLAQCEKTISEDKIPHLFMA